MHGVIVGTAAPVFVAPGCSGTSCNLRATALRAPLDEDIAGRHHEAGKSPATSHAWGVCLAGLPALVLRRRRALRRRLRPVGGWPCSDARPGKRAKIQLAAVKRSVLDPELTTPEPADASLWHNVDLYVLGWWRARTGLLRYVNEMPMGTLLKFEVQPQSVKNAIQEDRKGSERLASFGQPVPFNYGCFPQTYRDPEQPDKLYGAPGDDDPLDVLDLSFETVGVGTVVQCRPLGAVCLIDEGRADWKVLVVNTESAGALADAESVTDVERLAPGRIQQCLQWIDDFKRSSGKDDATLHFEVHDAVKARELIDADHASWRKLLGETGPKGFAREHWIRRGPGLWDVFKRQLEPLRQLPAPLKSQFRPLKEELKVRMKISSARGQWVRTPLFRLRWWVPTLPTDPWDQLKEQFAPIKEQLPASVKTSLSPLKEHVKAQIKTASGRR